MSFIAASKKSVSMKAYIGDSKPTLAFNFTSRDDAKKTLRLSESFAGRSEKCPGIICKTIFGLRNPANTSKSRASRRTLR
jgi:hypothetical protein